MPHFGRDQLPAALARTGIDYLHVAELGGRRRPAPDSPNGGWRNESFRGYADHMASTEFATVAGGLLVYPPSQPTLDRG